MKFLMGLFAPAAIVAPAEIPVEVEAIVSSAEITPDVTVEVVEQAAPDPFQYWRDEFVGRPDNAVHTQWDMLDSAIEEMKALRERGCSERMVLANALVKLAHDVSLPQARTAGRKLRKFAADVYAMALDRERVA